MNNNKTKIVYVKKKTDQSTCYPRKSIVIKMKNIVRVMEQNLQCQVE